MWRKWDDIQKLNGIITANLDVQTKMSTIDREEYDKVKMQGMLQIQKMDYSSKTMISPDIHIEDLQLAANLRPKGIVSNRPKYILEIINSPNWCQE